MLLDTVLESIKNDRRIRKYRNRKTRKMDDSDDSDEYSVFYSMDDIITYLEDGDPILTGGGTTRTQHTYTTQLLNEFIRFGWRREYVNAMFRRLHDKLLHEYPMHIFIEEYSNTAIRRLETSHESIKDSLTQIGLRPEIALQLELVVRSLQGSSYTNVQIIDTAIFYLLGHYKPLTPPNTKHLLYPDIIDTWVNYIYESKSISIYNMTQYCSVSSLSHFIAALATIPNPYSDKNYYFHATSWKGSLAITEGVNRLVGRRCLDFGILPGFYTSNSPNDAVGWGYANSQRWSNEVAIMIFCIPNNIIPSNLKFKNLTGDEWVQVTSHSRQCNDTFDLKLIKSIDILYGDMVQNASIVRDGGFPLTHTPPKKQLVSKSDAGDAFMYKCLIGCIYFKKSG